MPVWAAIDLGTNTAKLLVARRENVGAEWEVLAQAASPCRIGEGIGKGDPLRPEAQARALQALADFRILARQHGVKRMAAVATSAVRDAANRDSFASAAFDILGVPLTIIDGAREAELAFHGVLTSPVVHARLHPGETFFLVDIGGGSAQGILGDTAAVRWRATANVGAVRLTERCVRYDPIRPEEVSALRDAAIGELRPMLAACPARPAFVIGVGGTLATLASIDFAVAGTAVTLDTLEGCRLSADAVSAMIERLRSTPLAERRKTPGLDPARADIIVAGAVVASTFLAELAAPEFIVSTRGLRWGVLDLLSSGRWRG